MTIMEYAEKNGHKIIGRLTRRPEWEHNHREDRAYVDEAGNEYYTSGRGCCIVTVDGEVI